MDDNRFIKKARELKESKNNKLVFGLLTVPCLIGLFKTHIFPLLITFRYWLIEGFTTNTMI